MTDLLAELRAASFAVRQPHLDRIRALGVPTSWLANYPTHPFGVAQCEAVGPGLYQPGGGDLHVILPVLEDGALVDLVAFRSVDPGNWKLRTGNGWALGLEHGVGWHTWHQPADPASSPPRYAVGQPPVLFDNPLNWMRGEGDGICVLDWSAAEVRRLDVLKEVAASTPEVADMLRRALTQPPHLPKVTVMEGMRNAA